MKPGPPRLLVDASVAVKWHMPTEPNAAQARELLLDWQNNAVELCTPDQFPLEVANAFLTAVRRNRLNTTAAFAAIGNLLVLRLRRFKITNAVVLRASTIAAAYNLRVYDCTYVAIAERKGIEFWTDDQRLFNALGAAFPFIRWIANYVRKRP